MFSPDDKGILCIMHLIECRFDGVVFEKFLLQVAYEEVDISRGHFCAHNWAHGLEEVSVIENEVFGWQDG